MIGVRDAVHPSLDLPGPSLGVSNPDHDFLLLASCGVISAIGTVFLTRAYAIGKAAVVTTFEYTGILWAPLWGYPVLFRSAARSPPSPAPLLIVAAGLFAMLGGRSKAKFGLVQD